MSDCGICIGGDYNDGYSEFYSTTFPKAKKQHQCEECFRKIEIGQAYQNTAGKYDGDFYVYKICLDCMNIQQGLSCGNIVYGNLWEQIYEIFPQFNTSCLTKIKTVSAKEYILERWRKWKGLENDK